MLSAFRALPWRTRQTLSLTMGVWALGALQFVMVICVWAKGPPPAWGLSFVVLAVGAGVICSAVIYGLSRALERRPGVIRWPVLGVTILVLAAAQAVVDHLIYRLTSGEGGANVTYEDVAGVAVNVQIYLWLYGLYTVALALLKAMEDEHRRTRQLAEAREAAQEARLEALRFQLNPHFLFNTLNAISTLVIKNRNGEAEAMTGKLAKFLRTSFDTDPKAPIALIDELATIEAYLGIEGVRFGERLWAEIDCPPDLLEAQVPSFILQPLVENAVKYAVAPSRLGARIKVRAGVQDDQLLLTVEDTGRSGAAPSANGTGVGLKNTRARLAALFGPAAGLETTARETGFTARLRMPLRLDLEPIE